MVQHKAALLKRVLAEHKSKRNKPNSLSPPLSSKDENKFSDFLCHSRAKSDKKNVILTAAQGEM